MMRIKRSEQRGSADYGWLKANYSFSFAQYYSPEDVHFGALRVLNDDVVEGGMGFGMHPHDNMEIITIPLQGRLQHKDSMGFEDIISPGEIQIMSAGRGLMHSEHNPDPKESVNLLQIWMFPNQKNVDPRYYKSSYQLEKNKLKILVGPGPQEGLPWIYQSSYFSLLELEAGKEFVYDMQLKSHGLYAFVIDGELLTGDEILHKRDAIMLTQQQDLQIKAVADSKILWIESPMQW